MKNEISYLKKQIIYKCLYSGTKETDILYKKFILNKINNFDIKELNLILDLLKEYSDLDNYFFFNHKKSPKKKYKNLFEKIHKN